MPKIHYSSISARISDMCNSLTLSSPFSFLSFFRSFFAEIDFIFFRFFLPSTGFFPSFILFLLCYFSLFISSVLKSLFGRILLKQKRRLRERERENKIMAKCCVAVSPTEVFRIFALCLSVSNDQIMCSFVRRIDCRCSCAEIHTAFIHTHTRARKIYSHLLSFVFPFLFLGK